MPLEVLYVALTMFNFTLYRWRTSILSSIVETVRRNRQKLNFLRNNLLRNNRVNLEIAVS